MHYNTSSSLKYELRNMTTITKIPIRLVGRDRDSLCEIAKTTLCALEKINHHERDDRIVFYEEGHKYLIDGQETKVSCTKLVHSQFSKFDTKGVIKGIINSQKYLNGESEYSNMSPQDIEKEWERRGKEARNLGTEMHANIEFLMNSMTLRNTNIFEFDACAVTIEMTQFNNFCKMYMDKSLGPSKLVPYRTEWVIYDESIGLAGSIDILFKSRGPLPNDPNRSYPAEGLGYEFPSFEEKEERYYIFDWKRSKEMKTKYAGRGTKKDRMCSIKGSKLENCDYSKYSLQLNVYRRLIEAKYGIRVAGMVLVSIHPKHKDFQSYTVPFLDYEVDKIFESLPSI